MQGRRGHGCLIQRRVVMVNEVHTLAAWLYPVGIVGICRTRAAGLLGWPSARAARVGGGVLESEALAAAATERVQEPAALQMHAARHASHPLLTHAWYLCLVPTCPSET